MAHVCSNLGPIRALDGLGLFPCSPPRSELTLDHAPQGNGLPSNICQHPYRVFSPRAHVFARPLLCQGKNLHCLLHDYIHCWNVIILILDGLQLDAKQLIKFGRPQGQQAQEGLHK